MKNGIAATEDALNSQGSAMEENAKYLESIKGKTDQLSASFQKFSTDTLNSGFVKFLVDLARYSLDALDAVGLLTIALPVLGGVIAAKSLKDGVALTGWLVKLVPALGNASGAVLSFGAALQTALPILGIIAGITLISKAVDSVVTTFEEQKDKVDKLTEEYKTLKDTQEDLKLKIDETIKSLSALNELRKNGTITSLEKEQLSLLEKTSLEYKRQLDYLEAMDVIKAKELEREAVALINRQVVTAPSGNNDSNNPLVNLGIMQSKTTFSQQLQSNIILIKDYEAQIESLNAAVDANIITYEEWYGQTNALRLEQEKLLSQNGYLIDTLRAAANAIPETSTENIELKRTIEALIVSAEALATKITGTGDAVSDSGNSAKIAAEQYRNYAETVATLADSPSTKALNDAWKELDEDQRVSAETLAMLIDLYPEFTKYIDLQTGAITLTKDAIEDKFNLEKQIQVDTLKNLKDELTARLNLAKAIKAQIQMQYLGTRRDMLLNRMDGSFKFDVGSMEEQISAIDTQIALLSGVNLDTSTSGGGSTSSKSDDPWKNAFEDKLAEQKYLLDKDVITQKEYYAELLRLNNQYFANRSEYLDEFRQYDVEYFQGMKSLRDQDISDYISSVEELYKVHQDESQYIDSLRWAFENWSNMSDEKRQEILDKISSAENSKSENIISDIKHQIEILESRSATEEELIEKYQKIQDVAKAEADRLRSIGYGEDSTEVQKQQSEWLVAQSKKDDLNNVIHNREKKRIEDEIDSLERKGGMEKEIIKQYELLQVEAESQIRRLKEQGFTEESELVKDWIETWDDAYDKVKEMQIALTEDRLNDIEHEIFLIGKSDEHSGVDNSGKVNPEVIEKYKSLMQIADDELKKLYAQGYTANDPEVQEWQKRWHSYYDAVIDITKTAFEESNSIEKEALEEKSETIQKQIDSLEDIIDRTVSLIKHEKEEIIKSLEAQKDSYKSIIDKRKELLQTYHDEQNYIDGLKEKQKDVSDIENRLVSVSMDKSQKGQAEKLKLEEELAEKKKDLNNYQTDRALENQLDALDKENEAFDETIDYQIDGIKKYLEEEGTLRADAMKRIQTDGENLYNELIEYNRVYGTAVDVDITNAWTNAQSAMANYGGEQKSVLSTLQAMSSALDEYSTKVKSLSTNTYTPPQYSMSSNPINSGDSIKNQMKSNSDAWAASTDESEKKQLHDANLRLARNYEEVTGEKLTYNSAEGAWYADDGVNKKRIYHDGGFVGRPLSKSNELFGKLVKGEDVITSKQMDAFMTKTLPNMLAYSGAINPRGANFENKFEINFTGDVNKDTLPDLRKMLESIPEMVTKKFNETLSSRGIKGNPLIKSF